MRDSENPAGLRPFLDELLADQQRLQTPVARFAALQEQGYFKSRPAFAPSLIPLSAPSPGEQYAFEVDLDACTGCKACVAACHSLNGLDEYETWRDVGLLVGGAERHPFSQTVTTACHHCVDPACLNGCPVLAYEKDPVTGIVRHLDDQCIGCQYCVLKCPYDVPKYNERLGIVRKCDLCHSRLSEGEAPACVQACPTSAIRIVTVHTGGSADAVADDIPAFLAGAPDPAYTRPTTRYVAKRALPANLTAADAAVLRPQPAHLPLVVMLILTQAALGMTGAAAWLESRSLALMAATVLFAGLGASVLHLGRPLRAWRSFLGLRRSWMSREIVVFGAWLPLVVAYAVTPSVPVFVVGAVLGAGGVFCSAMVYVDTRRRLWRSRQTLPRFFGTVLIAGATAAFLAGGRSFGFAFALTAVTLAKLAIEVQVLRPLDTDDETPTPERLTAQLLTSRLFCPAHGLRIVAALGGVFLGFMIAAGAAPAGAAWVAAGLLGFGELTERYLFFRTVDAPKMPGVPAG